MHNNFNTRYTFKISDYIVIALIVFNLIGFRMQFGNHINSFLTFGWIISSIFEKQLNCKIFNNKITVCFIVFIVYSIITALFSGNNYDAIKINTSVLYTYTSILIFYLYIINKNLFMISLIAKLSIITISFTAIVGIIVFSFDQDISTLIISHRIKFHFYPFGHLLGSYFSLALITAVFSSIVLPNKINNAGERLIVFAFILLSIIATLKVRSSLTLIITLFSIFISLLYNISIRYYNYHKVINIVSTLLLLMLFIFIFISPEFLAKIIDTIISNKSSKLSMRLSAISNILNGSSASNAFNSADNRFNQLYLDISAFLKSPLLGYNYITAGNENLLLKYNLGMHSQLFDYLAIYGIFGFVPYLLMFIYHIITIKSYSKNTHSFIWILSLIILMIVNPFRDFVSIHTVFFLIPSIFILIGESTIENIYNNSRISK